VKTKQAFQICYHVKDRSGCDYYRAMMPMDTLHEQKLASVMRIEKGDDIDRVATAYSGADAVLFPRVIGNPQLFKIIDELHNDGKLVVADYDDWVWKVNPLSPHYKDYGLVEYQHVLRGEDGKKVRLDVWKEGVQDFCIKKNRERLKASEEALARVDLVTTTTEPLAEKLRKFNPNVAVLPNCVDFERWKPIELKPHDDVRLFWAGASSHFEDLAIIAPVLKVVMQRFPRVTLVMMGVKFAGILKDLPTDRVRFQQWEDNLSYPLRCATLGADIGLIPLVDNEFNKCKSAIKWIEQAALGIPSVVSGITPYAEMYNGENAVMVGDNSMEAWIEAISTLVRDPMLRASIGGEAQRYVKARYDIKQKAVDWLCAYEIHSKPAPAKVEEVKEEPWQLHSSATS